MGREKLAICQDTLTLTLDGDLFSFGSLVAWRYLYLSDDLVNTLLC
jgi:hypothetical protein